MTNYPPNDATWTTSTTSNPYIQGGWSPPGETNSREYLTGSPPPAVAESANLYGALPLVSPPTASGSGSPGPHTLIRFASRPPKNGQKINCAILDHHDHVHYNVVTENDRLTIIKDFDRKSVALIEWTKPVPIVDIRGGKGKRPVDQWLLQDPNHPRTRLMQWKDAWYSWITDVEQNELRLYQSQQGKPLAVVRIAGSMFEIEFAPNVLKQDFLEPCIVAIIMIKWNDGFFE
ncbi:hypothetical protein HWV62_7493 [Athelia sp. TMB]|nr:hypothetical protein HWV62_7493 [Athelia sp. TMB]